jgi:SAM-dependent methyltransferase
MPGESAMALDPTTARALVQTYHREERQPSASALDEALGLAGPTEPRRAPDDGSDTAPPHVATPYPVCRAFFGRVAPTARDLVVDLGCGTGRLLLYGGLTTPARMRGIEIVPERARVAAAAARRLELAKVSVQIGDVLETDWSDGTVFYAFRPFPPEVEAKVVERLHELACARPIVVAAHRMLPSLFDPAIFERRGRGDLRIYRVRH